MAIDFVADIDAMLQAEGVAVISAASSTFGLLSIVDAIEQTDGEPMQKRVTTVTVRTGSVTDLAVDLPITVGGKSYVVRQTDEEADGNLTKVYVAAVTP